VTFHISPPVYCFDTKTLFSVQLEYFSHMLLCVTFELRVTNCKTKRGREGGILRQRAEEVPKGTHLCFYSLKNANKKQIIYSVTNRGSIQAVIRCLTI